MSNDKFQDKYNEIFQEIKEEKMDWNFEDFLQKTEENSSDEKIVPIQKGSGNTKWFWLAASVILLFGLGMFFKFNFEEPQVQPRIVRNNIQHEVKPPISIVQNGEQVSLTRKINIEPAKKKKSRYKNNAQYLAQNSTKNYHNSAKSDDENIEYNPNFVIINGKPVATEEEAIKYTKSAINLLGGNINCALESAEPVKLLTVNF